MPVPTLAEVDAYEVPKLLIPRIAKEHHRTLEEATMMVREAKRMLYLCIVSGESIAPSDIVDEAWHEMLMFTRFYKDFGNFIGGFIHHDPTDPEMATAELPAPAPVETVPNETPTYTKMKKNYEKCFGEKPNQKYWP